MAEFYSWVGESLEDHSIDTLRYFRSLFEEGIIRILSGRFGWEISDIERFIVRLGPALHDVGKANMVYQETVKGAEIAKKDPWFTWHEVFSAHICWKLLDALRFKGVVNKETEDLRKMVLASILFHHQGLRSLEYGLPPKVKLEAWDLPSLHVLLVRVLDEASAGTLSRKFLEEAISKCLEEFKDEIVGYSNIREVFKRVHEYILEHRSVRLKLYSVISGPLIICDWLSARKHRGGKGKNPLIDEVYYAYALEE